ncbi:MAG: DCC1-like thiol-disulfide oxidoreductase family protein [Opitutaceae bacterium]
MLLYDGECGLCNAVMRFILKHDSRGVLMFASLQGRTGQTFLAAHGMNTTDFDSIVFIADLTRPDTDFYLRTNGALGAMEEMGGAYRRLARVCRVVPTTWRDALYRVVARMRYQLFGEYRPKPLPNPDWARRILD